MASTIKRNGLLHAPRHTQGGRFSASKTLPGDCISAVDAREKVEVAWARLGTWERVAEWFTGLENKKAAIFRLAKDVKFRPSVALLDAIERKPLPPETKATAVCPSCLSRGIREVHAAGDCHGLPVASVICLAPGEVVAAAPAPKPPKRNRPPCVRPYLSGTLENQIQQLERKLAEMKGKITPPTCTWEPDAARSTVWLTNCGIGTARIKPGVFLRFCPFCGRLLKVWLRQYEEQAQ
jgi:hypothetical protein